MRNDPIAYFLTWSTYGTWLPGDQRGWTAFQNGWQLPAPSLELEQKARMTDDACCLTADERRTIEDQIRDTCEHRNWLLHAVNCRSNHIHLVVSATEIAPTRIRSELKAWTTRRLKEMFDPDRGKWWAERGSIRFLFDDESLERAVLYTLVAQDRKDRDQAG